MKKVLVFMILAAMAVSLSACGRGGDKQSANPPEFHAIAYDPSLDTLEDEEGADAFDHTLDHSDTRYYAINDYYNMTSGDGLHILSNFQTYQQTTEYSCACASALMVLNYYGDHDYNELDICRLAGTSTTEGTSADELADFFHSLGWKTTCHADTECRFSSLEECENFFITTLDSSTPIMVDWLDWGGHWQVLIGLDTCDTDDPHDDVLIMADPYDTTDHYQDGYYVVPLDRFFNMWREGSADPYLQPFVIAVPVQE